MMVGLPKTGFEKRAVGSRWADSTLFIRENEIWF
jgi:hypothetical protein